MIRMLHAADLHLDSPFSALAPEQAAQRREEQRQVVRQLTQACERLDCSVLLLAGDLFDSHFVYRETVEMLREELGQISARVLIAPGNHDPWSAASVYATLPWPENVHIFHTRSIEAVRMEDFNLTVYGAAFLEPRQSSLLQGFTVPEDGSLSVMLMHGILGDRNSPYNPISEEEIARSRLRYLALGHVHRAEQRRIGATTVGNPGCAMGRGFDETGAKGAFLVELDETTCTLTQVFLGGRIYQTLSVRVGEDPRAEIEAALPGDTERDIYRITLTGNCAELRLSELRRSLAPRFYALELIDATQPPAELWQSAEEDSLKGAFLRRLQAIYDGAADCEARRLAADAARLGLAFMEGREVPEL